MFAIIKNSTYLSINSGKFILRTFIGLLLSLIATVTLTGCAHQAVVNNQSQKSDIQFHPYNWHDGTKGGVYGIGDGWTIELLAAKYGYETWKYGNGEHRELKIIHAEYEWIKDDTEDLSNDPEMKTVLVKIPAEYTTVTEWVVSEPAKTEYYFLDAKYSSNGSVLNPKTIELRKIPAVAKQVTRRVVKTPAQTVERKVPLERKRGFRQVLKTPNKVTFGDTIPTSFEVPKKIQPWKFIIKNPDGQTVHSFDDFNDLTIFMDTLK